MKCQSAIFEQVLLFGIAVAIFIISFTIFQLYQTHYTSISTLDHVKAVRDVIIAHITELTRIDTLNTSVVLKIPTRIGDEFYSIGLNNTAITVITEKTGIKSISSVEWITGGGLNYIFSGETRSSNGEIIIYKRGNNIIIG